MKRKLLILLFLASHLQAVLPDKMISYMNDRGVVDVEEIDSLYTSDWERLRVALSRVFSDDFPQIDADLIEGLHLEVDHLGIELYGPLRVYLPELERRAPERGLIYLGQKQFASTAVIQTLRLKDPTILGVTIGRIYFQNMESGKKGSLELFQVAPPDEQHPQSIWWTKERLMGIDPIDHLALRLDSLEDLTTLHERIVAKKLDTTSVLSYNPGDKSTHTKVKLSDQLIEFIHYGD